MSRRFHTILAVTLCLFPLIPSSAQTEQQKQTMSVLKAASERLMRGDIAALDEVKALPGDDSVAGLLMFFKQNFYVYSKETQKKAIAAKAAQYITECPTAADYIKRLFKKEEGRPKSGMLMNYPPPRQMASPNGNHGGKKTKTASPTSDGGAVSLF